MVLLISQVASKSRLRRNKHESGPHTCSFWFSHTNNHHNSNKTLQHQQSAGLSSKATDPYLNATAELIRETDRT